MKKLWINTDKYSGNHAREAVAYATGALGEKEEDYDIAEEYRQLYFKEVAKDPSAVCYGDLDGTNEVAKYENAILRTVQEVDDDCDRTNYNIDSYLGKGTDCCGFFIQLEDDADEKIISLFVERLKKFYKNNIKNTVENQRWKNIFHEERQNEDAPIKILNIVLTDESDKILKVYMRPYRKEEYLQKLVGNIFHDSTSSDFKDCDGLKVKRVIRELTDEDYDRELIDDSCKNELGQSRYEMSCMYEVEIENGRIIQVYEDEINPEYKGDFEEI